MLAFGTMVSTIEHADQRGPADPPTFSKDIAPILFDRCGSCHHPDGPAPFSLLTYAAARQRASLIARVTRTSVMPPWKSEPGYGDFVGHKHLSDAQLDLIQRWAAAGAPEGDPGDLPPPPTWVAGWQLGTPDLMVTWPEPFTVPAEGSDFSRTFVLPLPVSTTRYVRGFEFRPGNSAVVHHANIRIDRTPASRRLDDADPAPGYQGLLLPSAEYPDGHFLGWTPGQVAPLLPSTLAWRLTPGTDLVVEIHFVPRGKPEVVQPTVGLFFSEEPPQRTPSMLRLGRQDIDIAAGQRDYVTTDSFVLPVDVEVEAVQPHAHYLAREVRGTATLPDGTTRPLIYIKDWDFKWQHVYRYVEPIALPKGSTLAMRYTFDNSTDNVRNPHQPPRHVSWGQQSTDEMGDLWIQMLTRSEGDRQILNDAIRPKVTAEEIVGYEMMIRADPSNVTLHNDVAVMYDEIGRPDQAAVHFETVLKLQPDSAPAHYNFGTALSASRRWQDAIEQYQHALQLQPNYALAHNNLGHALLQIGKPAEALAHFREASQLDPGNANSHSNVATVLRALGAFADAIDEFRQAVRLAPNAVGDLNSLAWLLATTPSSQLREVRDANEAIRLAGRAAELTQHQRPSILDTLAAAQAAAGRFDLAVTTCEAALALKPSATVDAAIRQREALYRQGRPFVMPARTP